jgi:hypothetical protein
MVLGWLPSKNVSGYPDFQLLSKWFQTRRILWEFPLGFYVKLSSAVAAILVGGLKWRTHDAKDRKRGMKLKNIFSETTEPISTKLCRNDPWVVPFQNCVRHFRPPTKMAATTELNWRRFLCEFPIGSYVKLSSVVGAILVEGPNRRIYF